MLLADLGADVIKIARKAGSGWPNPIVDDRGRAVLMLVSAAMRADINPSRCSVVSMC